MDKLRRLVAFIQAIYFEFTIILISTYAILFYHDEKETRSLTLVIVSLIGIYLVKIHGSEGVDQLYREKENGKDSERSDPLP